MDAPAAPGGCPRAWCPTKLCLHASFPRSCRGDALIVAEDVLNPRTLKVVKRYTCAEDPRDYLAALGLSPDGAQGLSPDGAQGGAQGLSPEGAPAEPGGLHRYEVVPCTTTEVFAFFDVDAPVPQGVPPEAFQAEVERQVREDLCRHFGAPPASQAVCLSSSHTPAKASVHAVVRFATDMEALALDLAAIRKASPLGGAYDDIYNRFRCFRAHLSSKLPPPGGEPSAPRPLRPCRCSPRDPAAHVVRPLPGVTGPPFAPGLAGAAAAPGLVSHALPEGCPAAAVRAANRRPAEAQPRDAPPPYNPCAKRSEPVRELARAACASGIAADIGVLSADAFCFDKVSVACLPFETVVRAELSRRSFVCPQAGRCHANNRAVVLLVKSKITGARNVRFYCLDSQCRAAARRAVLTRTLL
jgi:hypothetical protein